MDRSQNANGCSTKVNDSQEFGDSNTSSRNGKMGDILRKIIIPKRNTNIYSSSVSSPKSPKAYPKLPDIQNLNLSATPDEARDWIAVKCHLNRARTLTKYDKHPRYMRALEENRDLIDPNLNNQWSICDDFSEGRQVNDAFVGGSNIPHTLKGLQKSLRFMNSLILDYKSSNEILPTIDQFLLSHCFLSGPFQLRVLSELGDGYEPLLV